MIGPAGGIAGADAGGTATVAADTVDVAVGA